jgi:type IV fimbrial biogenesis protein FimT
MLHQLKRARRLGQGGFTLVELMVALVVFSALMALGIPAMSGWMVTSKARAASEFYLDGFSTARRQAVSHNSSSRIVLTTNPNSGQMDWQVDICFDVPGTPCTNTSGVWSTTAAPAPGDPEGAIGFRSVFRSADALPDSDLLIPSILPQGATTVYYTALGWVNGNVPTRLTQLRLDPAAKFQGKIPSVALSITLAGMPSRCDPTLPTTDSRACPP